MPVMSVDLLFEDGNKLIPRHAISLLWLFQPAIADLFSGMGKVDPLDVVPVCSPSGVTAQMNFSSAAVMFDSAEAGIARTSEASALLWAAERLHNGPLIDRMLQPRARLPIPIVHDREATDLLLFDHARDVISCQRADPERLIEEQLPMLKALSSIAAAGLRIRVHLDGRELSMPDVSPTAFDHGTAAGRAVTSTGLVTGLYQVAKELEIRIEDCKKNKVIRARLSDAAHAAIGSRHPPFTAALEYSEPAPLLPLLPMSAGKVTIERMWDFHEQSELQFPV